MTCPIFTGSGESLPPLPRGAPHTRCAVEPSAGPPVAGHGHERGTPRRRNAGSHPPNGPGCEDSYIRPPFLPPPSLLPPLPPPPLPPAALVQVCRSHPYATSTCTRPRCPPATPAGRGERAACHPAAPCTGPQGPLRIGVALRGEPPKKGACRGGGGVGGPPRSVRLLSHLTGRAGTATSGSTATRPNSSPAEQRCSAYWTYPPQGGKRRGEEGDWHWCRAPTLVLTQRRMRAPLPCPPAGGCGGASTVAEWKECSSSPRLWSAAAL